MRIIEQRRGYFRGTHKGAVCGAAPSERREPTREEIARIVDPRAFVTFRQLCEERGLDADNPPPGVIVMEGVDVPVANRQPARDAALTKADAILALFRGGAE